MWLNEDQWLRFNNQFILKIKKQNPVLFIRQKKTLFSSSSSHDACRKTWLPSHDVVKLHDGVLIANRSARSKVRSTGVTTMNGYETELLISPLFLHLLFFHSLNNSIFCTCGLIQICILL
jgi:hypothetical protein